MQTTQSKLQAVADSINALETRHVALVRPGLAGTFHLVVAGAPNLRGPSVRSNHYVWAERAYRKPATLARAIVKFLDEANEAHEKARQAKQAADAAAGPQFTNVLHVGLEKK